MVLRLTWVYQSRFSNDVFPESDRRRKETKSFGDEQPGILWLAGWKKNNWKTASKKPVKNEELWKRLDLLCEQHEVNWKWVKGHAGDMGNERVDKLARSAMEPFKED